MTFHRDVVLKLLDIPRAHGMPKRGGSYLIAWLYGYIFALEKSNSVPEELATLFPKLKVHVGIDEKVTSQPLSGRIDELSGGDDELAFNMLADAIRGHLNQ